MNGFIPNGPLDAPLAAPLGPSTPPPPPLALIPPPPPSDLALPPPPADGLVPPPPPPVDPEVGLSIDDTEAAPPSAKKKKTGWGSQSKATPLSVEELLRKKREADEAASKVCCPTLECHDMQCTLFTQYSTDACHRILLMSCTVQPKFLSKAQREKLALEKRAREVEDARMAKSTITSVNSSSHILNR